MLLRTYLVIQLLFLSACGGSSELPQVPNFSSRLTQSLANAKEMARDIVSQKCKFAGFKGTGEDDAGIYLLDCEKGQYELYVTSSHSFEGYFTWKVGDETQLGFSETLLLKSVYESVRQVRETNAAYYLKPLGTVPIQPPPLPVP